MRVSGPQPYQWRLEKAERFILAARRAFEMELWETSVSRAYYALYHAAAAVLELRKRLHRDRWDHTKLLNDFREQFARPGFLFTIRDAKALDQLLQERLSADYERTPFDRRRAEKSLRSAEQLYDKIQGVIADA